MTRGWWNMRCFNGLSREQQHEVVFTGVLPWGSAPRGVCTSGAEVEITTMYDLMPGPRFYCVACAIEHLRTLDPESEWHDYDGPDHSPTVLHIDDVGVD